MTTQGWSPERRGKGEVTINQLMGMKAHTCCDEQGEGWMEVLDHYGTHQR